MTTVGSKRVIGKLSPGGSAYTEDAVFTNPGGTAELRCTYERDGQIRATTVSEIKAGGVTVDIAPELTRSGVLNEQHVNVCLGPGSCAFGPLQPNPVPKGLRIS